MRIVSLDEIRRTLDIDDALAAVAEGFRAFSTGRARLTQVGHLAFPLAAGDCHVKGASIDGSDLFVVKVATGFSRNPERGLSSSNGFMAVLSAETGAPLALLLDEGYLTDMRTAMAGAIAANRILRPGSSTIGVVGTGIQADLQARLIARTTGIKTILLWGRNRDHADRLARKLDADGFSASVAPSIEQLCADASLIVTTTPATAPIVRADMVPVGSRIIAVGADAPGKQELDTALVGRAELIVVDSREQCVDHGEAGWAVRAGLISATQLVELGVLLADDVPIKDDATVIVDLTGLGIQDLQIASSVWRRLA